MKRELLPRIAAALLMAVGAIATPAIARADCLTENLNNLPGLFFSGRNFKLMLVSDSGGWVSYSLGRFRRATSTSGISTVQQYFSDRVNANSPFSVLAPDQMTVTARSNGLISVHNATWNFDWSVNVSCVTGKMAMGNVGGTQVILSFGTL